MGLKELWGFIYFVEIGDNFISPKIFKAVSVTKAPRYLSTFDSSPNILLLIGKQQKSLPFPEDVGVVPIQSQASISQPHLGCDRESREQQLLPMASIHCR